MRDFQRPRPYTDPSLRRHHYGPIEPLDQRADLPRRDVIIALAIAALMCGLLLWSAL